MTNLWFLGACAFVAVCFGCAMAAAQVQAAREARVQAAARKANRGRGKARAHSADIAQGVADKGHPVQVIDLATGEVYEPKEK